MEFESFYSNRNWELDKTIGFHYSGSFQQDFYVEFVRLFLILNVNDSIQIPDSSPLLSAGFCPVTELICLQGKLFLFQIF